MQLRLKVVKGKPQGHCLSFPVGEFMFGRGPECDVRPNSDLVSRQHCLVRIGGDNAVIRDLGSRNGTLVNGQLVIGERPLCHGDTVQIGPLVLEVLLGDDSSQAKLSMGETAMVNQNETTTNQLIPPETCAQPLPLPAEQVASEPEA
jgi:pSer/pThr/pTyr-binding forkhead associated (FHA) protein